MEKSHFIRGGVFVRLADFPQAQAVADAVVSRALPQTDGLADLLDQEREEPLASGHDLCLARHPELDPSAEIPAPQLFPLESDSHKEAGRSLPLRHTRVW